MKNLIGTLVFSCAVTMVLGACGVENSENDIRIEKIASLTGDANAGLSLYDAKCMSCHGMGAKGGTSGPDLIGELKEEPKEETAKYINYILNGKGNVMPAFGGDNKLKDQEIADIMAYLTSLTK